MTIAPDTPIVRAPGLAQRLFEEQMLVISARDSMLHRFNAVGTFIWRQLEKPITIHDLLTLISNQFQGFDGKKNRDEIARFLNELEKKGLVVTGKGSA